MMGKGTWLLGGLLAGGIATAILMRRRGRSDDGWDDYGYDDDAIDAGGPGGTFGDRPTDAPEQRWAAAETGRGVTEETPDPSLPAH